MEAKKVFKIGKSLHETLNKRKLDIFLNNLGINLDKEEDIRYNRQALKLYMEKSPSPVYGARLELVYGLIAHRGFESLSFRHITPFASDCRRRFILHKYADTTLSTTLVPPKTKRKIVFNAELCDKNQLIFIHTYDII